MSCGFDVSPTLDETLQKLVEAIGSASKSEVLRRAIALMEIASNAKLNNEKIIIADQDRNPKAEIIF